jgi:hypothetical protein
MRRINRTPLKDRKAEKQENVCWESLFEKSAGDDDPVQRAAIDLKLAIVRPDLCFVS